MNKKYTTAFLACVWGAVCGWSQEINVTTAGVELGAVSSTASGALIQQSGQDTSFVVKDGVNAPAVRMIIKGDGKVGIGTTTPGSPLVVRDDRTSFLSESPLLEIRTFDGRFVGFTGPTDHTASSPFIFKTGNAFEFRVDSISALLINSGGRLGLGTANIGTYKLAVNGQVKAKGFVTDTSNWADYVFAPDYRLAPLSEVEQHIKEKGHLPGLPSENEVKANGVDLGDMQVRLLTQIEQLNLHLIAQEKRLQAQEARIRELVGRQYETRD